MRKLHLDCPSGIAGDMFLASLIDLGAPLEEIRAGLESLELTEPWSIRTERVAKWGITALQLLVEVNGRVLDGPASDQPHGHAGGHDHDHHHDHGHSHDHNHDHHHDHIHEHVHRPYRAIKEMLQAAELPARVRTRALKVFAKLALSEGTVHGIDPEDVHFHEVGSTDAIIDIVGSCLALELLGIDALTSSPLHVGRGFVRAAHGRMPVPAPATLLLLEGLEAYQTDITGELVTPTGAAIVAALCDTVGPMSALRVEKVGCGAGRMDLPIPNILRAVLYESSGPAHATEDTPDWKAAPDEIVEIEANLDDISPEVLPFVFDRLFAAGAKDAWVVPVTMKKGRPGWVLHVLGAPESERALVEIVFQETTTLGMRVRPARRWTLEREWVTVAANGGAVRVKVGRMGGRITNVAPEYEDCRKAAVASGLPLKAVMDEARETARRELNIP